MQDTSSRWDKVVILKHLFTLKELEVRTLLLILQRPAQTHDLLTTPFVSSRSKIAEAIAQPATNADASFRKTPLPYSISKKTSVTNAPKWPTSPMWFCSTRKLKVLQVYVSAMPREQRLVSEYVYFPPRMVPCLESSRNSVLPLLPNHDGCSTRPVC